MEKMSDAAIRKEASMVTSAITSLNATLRALTFELGAREDKRCCESEDPDRWCSHCNCWKMTRQRCG